MDNQAARPVDPTIPLCVDLDGTLTPSDTLIEGVLELVRRKPHLLFMLPIWLLSGRARFKAKIEKHAPLDPAHIPYNDDLLAHLQAARNSGRKIVLVTAANEDLAGRIAAHLGCFDEVLGSTPGQNLKGQAKADALSKRFGDGFAYAGDALADAPVWQAAAAALPVGNVAKLKRAIGSSTPIEASFAWHHNAAKELLRAFRMHHWSKNLLIFVPMILAHEFWNPVSVLTTIAALFVFSFIASATYMVNDLLDLAADRAHPTKQRRPIAAARLPLHVAILVPPMIYIAGLVAAFWLSTGFGLCVLVYLIVTKLYSMAIKRMAILDAVTLAGLFTLRLLMGVFLLSLPLSLWLIMFSMVFFGGLAFVKRFVELRRLADGNTRALSARGYHAGDQVPVLAIGIATTTLSIFVLVLYLIESQIPSELYARPQWLWIAPAVLYFWQARIWLLAYRGKVADDPIVFAIKDPTSWVAGLVVASAMAIAV